jgi:hypothetical protein
MKLSPSIDPFLEQIRSPPFVKRLDFSRENRAGDSETDDVLKGAKLSPSCCKKVIHRLVVGLSQLDSRTPDQTPCGNCPFQTTDARPPRRIGRWQPSSGVRVALGRTFPTRSMMVPPLVSRYMMCSDVCMQMDTNRYPAFSKSCIFNAERWPSG